MSMKSTLPSLVYQLQGILAKLFRQRPYYNCTKFTYFISHQCFGAVSSFFKYLPVQLTKKLSA